MDEQTLRYRFSLRSLFLFVVACSLLLCEWKLWGIANFLGTLTTLVVGIAFARYFSKHPFQNSRKVTIACVFFSLGNFVLVLALEFLVFHFDSLFGVAVMGQADYLNGLGIAFLSILFMTVLVAWMLRLTIEPRWSLLFPLLILFNLWFGAVLSAAMTDSYREHASQFGSQLLEGYATALAFFAIALVLRWVKSLPTTREDVDA